MEKLHSDVIIVTQSPGINKMALCFPKRSPRALCDGTKCELLGTRRSDSQAQAPEVTAPLDLLSRNASSRIHPVVVSKPLEDWEHGGSTPSPDGGEVRGGRRWHRGCHLRGAGRAGTQAASLSRPRRRWRSRLPPTHCLSPSWSF